MNLHNLRDNYHKFIKFMEEDDYSQYQVDWVKREIKLRAYPTINIFQNHPKKHMGDENGKTNELSIMDDIGRTLGRDKRLYTCS